MLADQQLELADKLGTRAKHEIGLDPLLEGFEPKLLEPSELGLRPGLVGELGQRLASPKRERLPQQHVRVRRSGSPSVSDELLEPQQVKRPRIDSEPVSRGGGPDHDAAQRTAELETYFCRIFAAVAGGRPPHRSSIRRSLDTSSFA